MNNSIFKSMMRVIMIVLPPTKKLHAVQSWKKGKYLVCGQTEALRSSADLFGIFDFLLSLFSFFFFSNEYFLIIIYIKYLPNRLFCWMIFSVKLLRSAYFYYAMFFLN